MLIYSAVWAPPYPSVTLIYSFGLCGIIKISYFLKSSLALFSSFFCHSLDKLRVFSFVCQRKANQILVYAYTSQTHKGFCTVWVRVQQTDRKFILAVCTTITNSCQHEQNFNGRISKM